MQNGMKVLFSNLYGDYKTRGYISNHTYHFPFLDFQLTKI